jgi:hypothetical protein
MGVVVSFQRTKLIKRLNAFLECRPYMTERVMRDLQTFKCYQNDSDLEAYVETLTCVERDIKRDLTDTSI